MAFLNPVFIISILIALSVHECAHALIANRLGDPTAEHMGRLTLNPIAHIDPLGAIMFLFVGIGWGKPVPINPMYFRHPKRDTALVSLGGPASNLLIGILCFVLLRIFFPGSVGDIFGLLSFSTGGSFAVNFFQSLLATSLFTNLGLMAFNLIPLAPLDGSKILEAFIPLRYEEGYLHVMRYGPFILLGLLLAERITNLPLLGSWIFGIMNGVLVILGAIGGRL